MPGLTLPGSLRELLATGGQVNASTWSSAFTPGQRIVSIGKWISVSRNILLVLDRVDRLRAGTGD
jgi:hypothetical protein